MGKIIISQKILGQHFPDVAVKYANALLKDDTNKAKKIQTELNSVKSISEFIEIFEKYFNDDIIIKL